MLSKKRTILVIIFFLVLIFVSVGSSYFWSNYHEYKVSINNPELSSVELGSNIKLDGDLSSYKPTHRTENSRDIFKLKKGRYTLRISRPGYESQFSSISVPEDKTFSAPKLSLNKVSIDTIKKKNSTSINQVITGMISDYGLVGYTITNENYFDDTWYAALLSPAAADAGSLDAMRLILKRTTKGWSVAVPPTIVIYNQKYPKIPKNIISYTNNALR
jgi:hypothetical protein